MGVGSGTGEVVLASCSASAVQAAMAGNHVVTLEHAIACVAAALRIKIEYAEEMLDEQRASADDCELAVCDASEIRARSESAQLAMYQEWTYPSPSTSQPAK